MAIWFFASRSKAAPALLWQLPLDDMLKKLTSLNIHNVELGTGNYPRDAHCKTVLTRRRVRIAEVSEYSCPVQRQHQRSDTAIRCTRIRNGRSTTVESVEIASRWQNNLGYRS